MLKLCLELTIAKKWCMLFVYQPPDTKLFIKETYFTVNKILSKYDNIFLAYDLNKPVSDWSNHLSDTKNVFNLTNLVKKPTCFKSQNHTLIDLILTNRPRSFLKSQNFENVLVIDIKLNHFVQDLDSRSVQGELYWNCDEPWKNSLKFLLIFLIIMPH